MKLLSRFIYRIFGKVSTQIALTTLAAVCIIIFEKSPMSIVLSLLYSIIAAYIFHFFVVYCPRKVKQVELKPFIETEIQSIRELLRQSYQSVLPTFSFSTTKYTIEDYACMFKKKDLYEKYHFSDKTILNKLTELQHEIRRYAETLLAYREFLSAEEFTFITKVLSSSFIKNDIFPNSDELPEEYQNQEIIGRDIYNLYNDSIDLTE